MTGDPDDFDGLGPHVVYPSVPAADDGADDHEDGADPGAVDLDDLHETAGHAVRLLTGGVCGLVQGTDGAIAARHDVAAAQVAAAKFLADFFSRFEFRDESPKEFDPNSVGGI